MAKLDLLLLVGIGIIALGGLVASILSFRQAMRVSGEKDGDVKMFLWAALSMIGLIVAGTSVAYILLPIILH